MENQFEETIRNLTKPVNGQYPRPWMSEMKNPWDAEVFIVGRNQARAYDVHQVNHKRHLDALFNRSGETCRGLYDEVCGGTPSESRNNIEALVGRLSRLGIHNTLETNVVCYSTPTSGDLTKPEHARGCEERGRDLSLPALRNRPAGPHCSRSGHCRPHLSHSRVAKTRGSTFSRRNL